MRHQEMRSLEQTIENSTGTKVQIREEPWTYRFSIRKNASHDEDTREEMQRLNKWLKAEMGFTTRMAGGTWASINVK